MRIVLCLLLVAVLAIGAQALNIRTAVGADPATKKGALAPSPAAPAPQGPAPAGPADPSKGQQQDAEKEEDDDGKEVKLVEKPLSPELQKIADERAANLKELKINETAPWVPLAADAENYEIQYLTKLGQAAGKKLKSLKQLMALLSKEAADGMRDFDQVILSGKEKKPIVLYEVSKGKYDTKRPNNPGFAALATKKLSKVQAVMCKKPNGEVKKVCSKLIKAKQKVTDFLTGKINKLVDFVKDIFENDNAPALIEEKTSMEVETQAKYKIYSQGAHHEQMVCEALKLATWVGVDPLLQNYITPHFNGATDCDDAISKYSSTFPQWWPTIGARWQDVPCFGSDAAVFDDSFVDTCYRLPNQYLNQLGYRSHISDRVYWHSMTSAQVALTHPTQRDVRSTIIRQARNWLRQATTPPPGYVNAIAMKPFLWNLGRVSHMIGDSFACGHCVRDALPPHGILYFQDYAGQSSPWRGEDHAYFDSHAQVGISTGTLRVQALNQELVQIFLAEATRVLTGAAYVPATASGAGAANGRVELTRWMVANVYNFYSANHRAYNGLGCQVKSTTKNRVSACPQNLLGTADPANICPDFPRAPNTEFL